MGLAINTIDGRGFSNEARREVLPNKSKVTLYLLFISQYQAFNQLYITNKTERFNFKSGCSVWVVKLIKEDWPIVLE